jgi:hypothetical protein
MAAWQHGRRPGCLAPSAACRGSRASPLALRRGGTPAATSAASLPASDTGRSSRRLVTPSPKCTLPAAPLPDDVCASTTLSISCCRGRGWVRRCVRWRSGRQWPGQHWHALAAAKGGGQCEGGQVRHRPDFAACLHPVLQMAVRQATCPLCNPPGAPQHLPTCVAWSISWSMLVSCSAALVVAQLGCSALPACCCGLALTSVITATTASRTSRSSTSPAHVPGPSPRGCCSSVAGVAGVAGVAAVHWHWHGRRRTSGPGTRAGNHA